MSLSQFSSSNLAWRKPCEHERYGTNANPSALMPVAPEWATAEVVLGGAYRTLVLGIGEGDVDRDKLRQLPTQFPESELWSELLTSLDGLASPTPKDDELRLPLVMPLVPELARFTAVLGRPRSRWNPGNLLVSTVASGARGFGNARLILDQVRQALTVDGGTDDILAFFLESQLRALSPETVRPETLPVTEARAPAWRSPRANAFDTPSERFVADLPNALALKQHLTRRQWTTLLEGSLRFGLAVHALWLCKLNHRFWRLLCRVADEGHVPVGEDIDPGCWEPASLDESHLELGRDAIPMLKQAVRNYAAARIGINVVLHALDDAGSPWPLPLGVSSDLGVATTENLLAFAVHVHAARAAMLAQVSTHLHAQTVSEAAFRIADANPRLLSADSGFASNMLEFVRYSLRQLQTSDPEQQDYDQTFILQRKNRSSNTPWPVELGPSLLVWLVHACCRTREGVPASIDDFRQFLREYGLNAPSSELRSGRTGRNLELLGLVIDSPDAGGGRLLVDPF